jgi:exodeoxyribonuclease-5
MPDGDFKRLVPDLSLHQREGHDKLLGRLKRGEQKSRLDGPAGTGKTHVMVELGLELGAQFAAPTGKAVVGLRQRGATNAVTLHSLIYDPPRVKDGELVWRPRKRPLSRFIFLDECDQIDARLGRDLLATGTQVLGSGDPAQLPPVCGDPFFTGEPDFTLTEIHRQAANSQPLMLATAIREGKHRRSPVAFDIDAVAEADIVIVALNRTRRRLNQMIRKARGISGKDPVVGDRMVGLRNNARTGVMNGSLWAILEIERRDLLARMTLVDDIGTVTTVTTHSDGWFCSRLDRFDREYRGVDLLDYGYCLTAHKAQGSEWPRVVVIDETDSPGFELMAGEMPPPEFKRRWMYTAVSRAKTAVTVMGAPR